MVVIGKSLLIFSEVTFKMAAWWPYWIFWFPHSNFSLALNINSKLKWLNSIQFNSVQNMFIVQCTASIQNSISYHNQGWVLQQYLKIRHTRQALSRGNTVSVQMLSSVISKKAIYSHKSNSPRHSGRGSAGHSVPRALWYVNTSWRR